MSDVSLTGSSVVLGAGQHLERIDSGHGGATRPQSENKAGLSNSVLARLFGVSTHEIEAYVASQSGASSGVGSERPTNDPVIQEPVAMEPTVVAPQSTPAFTPWDQGKPATVQALVDFMASRAIEINLNDAAHFLYGSVGANEDLRNFDAILNSPDPFEANNQALGYMFNDPSFVHSANQAGKVLSDDAVAVGNLIVDNHRLCAATADGEHLVPIRLPKAGMYSGGLARYGITDEEAGAVLSDSSVSEKVKTMLAPYMGTGYKPEDAEKYVTHKSRGFDLSSVIGG